MAQSLAREALSQRISKVIIEKREEIGLSQTDLASLVRVSPSTISAWERAVRPPSTKSIPILANALDVSIDTLFGIGEVS